MRAREKKKTISPFLYCRMYRQSSSTINHWHFKVRIWEASRHAKVEFWFYRQSKSRRNEWKLAIHHSPLQFFHPPQRTVPCHNGLLDTRTKHTIAQDRWLVAEQRTLEAERRKSASNLQLLQFEQKQLEKKLAMLQSQLGSRTLTKRGRSTSEVLFPRTRRSSSWTDTLPIHQQNVSVSLNNSNQQLLALPRAALGNDRRSSIYSDGDASETGFFTSDMDSGGEEGENDISVGTRLNLPQLSARKHLPKRWSSTDRRLSKMNNEQNKRLPPLVAIIPPDDDLLFLYH